MSKQEDENYTVPSDPAIRKAIRDAIQEASAQMQMVSDRKEAIKEIAANVEETYNVPKKVFNKLAKVFHQQSYANVVHEDEVFQLFYENIVGDKT